MATKDMVLVGCNLPNGYVMQCYAPRTVQLKVLGGGVRDEVQYFPDPTLAPVKINGPAVPFGERPRWDIKNGYGFTEVSRKFWERWAPFNKDILASKAIICDDTIEGAFARAKEFHKDFPSGLQPLRKKKDPRVKITLLKEIQLVDGEGDEAV
jgi:hypothetical protein